MACAAPIEVSKSDGKSVSDEHEQLNCAICLETYKCPRNLACLHTFCEGCIHSHILQTTEGTGPLETIQCPLCRSETVSPCPTKPRTEWVKELPINYAIVSEQDTILPNYKRDCGNCTAFGKTTSATSFCEGCKQFQCEACVSAHSKSVLVEVTKHTIVNLDDYERDASEKLQLGKLGFCLKHVDKEVEMYCQDDKVLCCFACAFMDHKSCGNVKEVKQLGQDWKTGDKLQEIETRMKDLMTKLGEACEEITSNISELEAQAEDIPRKLLDVRDNVMKMLDELVSKVTTECGQLKKQHTVELDDKKTSIKSMEAAITTTLSLLLSLLKRGSETQIVIVIHKLEEQINQYETQLDDLVQNTSLVNISLSINDTLEQIIQSAQKLDTNIRVDLAKLKQFNAPLAELLIKVKSVVDIPKQQQYNQPRYRGIEQLPNGQLVAADYRNHMCCLMDDLFNVIASVKLPSEALDVTVMAQTEVVVSCARSKTLQRVTIEGNTLKLTGTISCSREVYSVSRLSDTELVVGYSVGIGIISLAGKERSYFEKDQSGRAIQFGAYERLVTDPSRPCIHFSNYNGNTVSCIDLDGKVHFSHSKNLKGPSGLTLDRDHNLYICSRNNSKIHQLTPDGRLIKEIDPGVSDPYTTCFNPDDDELTVVNCHSLGGLSMKGYKLSFLPAAH